MNEATQMIFSERGAREKELDIFRMDERGCRFITQQFFFSCFSLCSVEAETGTIYHHGINVG